MDQAQALEKHQQGFARREETLASLEGMSDTLVADLRRGRQLDAIPADPLVEVAGEQARALPREAGSAASTNADGTLGDHGINGATADWAPANAPPPRIEGYEIVGRLGEGGMGVVWKAIHTAPTVAWP